jgi:aspartate aminotransferase
MKELSRVASAVQASTTVAIDSKAKQMKADGIDVVGFGAGEPDFNTPDNINMEAIRAICDGKTKYTPPAGIIPLRKAICNRLKLDCNLDYDYTQIVVASGAKHCVYVTFRALLNPGDEVIVPAPYWVSYSEMIKMAGGVPILVVAGEDQGFKATGDQIKAAITEKTKCVIINNPSNPTGALYSKQELQEIADICVENDLYIISDEIYYQLIYDNAEFVSIASLGKDVYDHTIIINGVSKSYAMTGWRIGYVAASKEIAKVMSNYLSHSTGAPSTISQWASIEALNGPQEGIEAMRQEFEKRRNYMVKRMNEIPGVSCRMPEGAFYVMMNISQLLGKTIGGASINSADDFAMAFLDHGLVAVVPSTGFGIDNFVRWSYATSMENIEEGLNRLEKFLNQ